MLGVALVGLGNWGEKLAEAVQKSDRLNLVNVFARDAEKRRRFQTKYHCAAANSFTEILHDPGVNGIILATPNSLHEEQISLAVQYGKDVLVEKPLAATVEQACRIALKARKMPIIVAVGHNSRRLPESRLIKQWLLEERIGKPVLIEANWSTDTGFTVKPEDWRWSKAECASGPLIQLGVHHADTLQYLLGPVKKVTGFQKRLQLTTEIMDTTGTLLEFSSGCLGYIGSSYVTPRTYRLVVYGTAGQIFCDDRFGLYLDTQAGTERIDLQPVDRRLRVAATLVEEVNDFATCMLRRQKPEVSITEGLTALAVTEAAALSQLRGGPVTIAELCK